MTDNVGAYAVAGLGGLENVAKRNVKPDQLRTVHKPKCFKETNLRIYTSPRYWICTMLSVRLRAVGRCGEPGQRNAIVLSLVFSLPMKCTRSRVGEAGIVLNVLSNEM